MPLSAEGELVSRELGLILRPQGDWLRLVDDYTHQILLTSAEAIKLAQRTEQAEAKIVELQQELERLRGKKG